MSSQPVSLIIPTFNRSQKLMESLESLYRQSFSEFELIVVIDGSNDGTADPVREKSGMSGLYKILKQENKGRSSARNHGAREASNDLLIFYDDDVIFTERTILKHLEFHHDHDIAICGGNIIELQNDANKDFERFRWSLTQKWTGKYREGINLLEPGNLFLTAANFSIKKDLFLKLGGFNEGLSDAEDFELAVRAFLQGIPVYFDKSNIVYHNDSSTCDKFIKRGRQYSTAKKLIKNSASGIDQLLNSDSLSHHRFKKLIFSLFSHSCWIRCIDREKLNWVPPKLRYLIYDLVITGLISIFPERKI